MTHNFNDPREKELDIQFELAKAVRALKARVAHLETLENSPGLVLLDKVELTADAALITFANISQAYASLKIIMSVRVKIAATNISVGVRFNNDTAANYDSLRTTIHHTAVVSTGETIASSQGFIGSVAGDTAPADVFSTLELIIPDYTGANEKSMSGSGEIKRANTTSNIRVVMTAMWWKNTSPITEIDFRTASADDFAAGSKFYLYGLI